MLQCLNGKIILRFSVEKNNTLYKRALKRKHYDLFIAYVLTSILGANPTIFVAEKTFCEKHYRFVKIYKNMYVTRRNKQCDNKQLWIICTRF